MSLLVAGGRRGRSVRTDDVGHGLADRHVVERHVHIGTRAFNRQTVVVNDGGTAVASQFDDGGTGTGVQVGQQNHGGAGGESRFPGLPYVVFPGNVGDESSLAQAVQALRKQ